MMGAECTYYSQNQSLLVDPDQQRRMEKDFERVEELFDDLDYTGHWFDSNSLQLKLAGVQDMRQKIKTNDVKNADQLSMRMFIDERKTARLIEEAISMEIEHDSVVYQTVSTVDTVNVVDGLQQAITIPDLSSF